MMASPAVYGTETTATLDRCVVLNAENDTTVESKIPLHFALPNEVVGKELIYAELHMPVSIENQESSSLFELRLYPALSDWSEAEIDFDTAGDIADSICVGSFTVSLADSNDFHIDITHFVREVVAEERSNHGLIGVGDLLGESNLQLPEALGQSIKNSARVKIVYK
jgi:hypothetical protein